MYGINKRFPDFVLVVKHCWRSDNVKKVEEEGVVISDLVTNRHSQIKAYMKKERTAIHHWFDVWHMAKVNSVYVI